MLAEIFQENDQFEELMEWQRCKEFLTSDQDEPKLPDKMDITRLYQMFIEKKRNIFMDKGNPTDNTTASHALIDQFETCLAYQRSLSLELMLGIERCRLFSCYRQGHGNVAVNTLKIGIVQILDDEVHFIHRTFAEYFVAQGLLLELQTENGNVEFQRLFVEEILVSFQFNVIRGFLDDFVKPVLYSLPCRVFEAYQSVSYKVDRTYEYKLDLLHNLAGEGHVSILQLILRCIEVLKEMPIIDEENPESKFGNVLNMVLARVQREGLDIMNVFNTLLGSAAECGRLAMVKFLVQMGANVNAGLCKPHHQAVQRGYFEVLKFLVEHGADITSKDLVSNSTILYKAVGQSDTAITAYLLDRTLTGSNPDDSLVLYAASSLGRLDIVERLLERGVDVDSRVDFGETPVFGAAKGAQLETLRYLSLRGCDMNAKSSGNDSVLQIISCNSLQLATAKLLIELGVDVNNVSLNSNTALHSAVASNNFDLINLLVSSGANVNLRDRKGATALHIAASKYQKDTVRFLLSHGADTDVKDNCGRAPLHVTVWNNVSIFDNYGYRTDSTLYQDRAEDRIDTIKILIEHGNINVKDGNGRNALHFAVDNNDLSVAEFLVQAGADLTVRDNSGYTALHLFARNYVTAEKQTLKHRLAIVGIVVACCGKYVDIRDETGRTVLHWAASIGDSELVDLLATNNADINIIDGHGQTALHLAVGHPDTVDFLVKHGADVSIRDSRGRMLLHLAAEMGDLDTVRFLAEMGIDIDVKDDEGSTPLQLALDNCHANVFEYMFEIVTDITLRYDKVSARLHSAVKSGNLDGVAFFLGCVDINGRDGNGDSMLHSAVCQTSLLIVKFLVKSGIDVDLKDRKGRTALYLACEEGYSDIVDVLVGCGANVNVRDNQGSTALHSAVDKDLRLVMLLVGQGADIYAEDLKGDTPVIRAKKKNRLDVFKYLQEELSLKNRLFD